MSEAHRVEDGVLCVRREAQVETGEGRKTARKARGRRERVTKIRDADE